MKLTIILLVSAFLQVNASGFAQKVSLNVEDVTIKKVFYQLTKQTGYNFIYDSELLKDTRTITLHVDNQNLKDVLDKCFEGQSLDIIFNTDKTIVIKKKQKPGIDVPAAVPIVVKGVVTDENGQPLPGAVIRLKGTAIGAAAGNKGEFTINVPDNNKILVISMIGHETIEITVTGDKPLQIVLKQQSNRLNDVVVVGYGVQRKGDLTGAISGISEKEIQQSKSISFMEALQGRLAGVQVTSSSGEPGGAVSVNIRGTNSFNSGTQPLCVIDGVQIDVNNAEAAASGIGSTSLANPLSGINPTDIASIEVLKDASATAIFGSRGANGVIVITTKSGKNNSSALEVNSYTGISSNPKRIPMLGAQDYANYRLITGSADDTWADDLNNDGVFDRVKDFSGVKSHDWQKEALRNAIIQNYNVSYSGGSAKTNFSTSATYLNQEGLILNNKYERYSLLMKVNHNATDRLRLGANINLSHAIGTGVASNGGNDVRNYNGLIQNLMLTRPVNVPDPSLLSLDPDGATFSSPIDFVNLSYKKSPLSRVLTDLSANYRIIPGLYFDTRVGAVLTMSSNGEFYPSTVSWGIGTNGLAAINRSNASNWYQSNTLTWNKRIAKYHSITALLGLELNSYIIDTYRWQGQGFDIQSINPLDNIATAKLLPFPPGTDKQKFNRLSEFARLNYAFKDKYLLTATLRNDASSKLSANKKSALFPSIGAAWRMSSEAFLKKQQIITDLKIRGSFGVTGNERIPPYQSLATLSNVYYSSASGSQSLGLAPGLIANPNLTWETTVQYSTGIDLSLWNDRIALTADFYLKQTKDLLIQADIPSQTGYMKQYQNLGQIDNRGIELALNTINIKKGDFKWSSNISFTVNRNKVVSLGTVKFIPVNAAGGAISSIGRVIVGQPIGTGYGYVFDGIYQINDFSLIKDRNGNTVDPSTLTGSNYPNYIYTLKPGVPGINGRVVRPGDLKYKDLNGDGKVDNTNDYTTISNSNPKHYGGLSNTFTYKNFDLSFLLNWSYGNDILYLGKYRIEAGGGYFANVTQEYFDNRWLPENPTNSYPGLTSQGKTDISSYYTKSGSYLRVRNVTLSYTLKAAALKKLGLDNVRFYATGENLYTWTNYPGFDPEISSYTQLLSGVDNITYPRAITAIFGLNLKF
ncbi:MAG TPA: TonB-dependent receptor [Pedobacter sp.]|uniref:TonB-dependent receptor n=1 Tax=Pedobacter sp. TaxID=1411316 RepID=UPI002BD47EAC|nr:TonB-dependent receptor [Pedobacter sp.]HMI03569.1 TonB-dependent receptor [Pedobacter sp.]